MSRLLFILLLISTSASGQTLFKSGKTDGITSYFGIHKYNIHPSWSEADSLWFTNKKYVDSLLATAGISGGQDGNGFDFGLSGSQLTLTTSLTTNSIPYIGASGALSQNNTLLNWDNSTSIFTTGHIRNTTTNTYDIGTASLRYRNLYVNGINVNVSGAATANQVWFNPGAVLAVTQTPSVSGANIFSIQSSASAATSGFTNLLNISIAPFQPTSGTARWATIFLHNVINQTGTASGPVRGIFDSTRITAINSPYRAYENAFGEVLLNSQSGVTGIGSISYPRKFYVNGSIGMHVDSSETITSLGSDFVQIIDASTGKFKKITGANLGVGGSGITSINSESGPSFTIAGGNGLTVNTTTNTATVVLGGTLSGATNIAGATNDLNLGTSISRAGSVNIHADAIGLNSQGGIALFGQVRYAAHFHSTDADYTVPENLGILELSSGSLTADRTITLPAASAHGQTFTIVVRSTSSSNHYVLSSATVDNKTGSTFTQLDYGTTYDFMVNGSIAWVVVRKY